MGMEQVFEMGVVISAMDHFTGPMRKMASEMSSAQKNINNIKSSMKMLGKSSADIDRISSSLQKMGARNEFAKIAKDLKSIGMAKSEIDQLEQSYMRLVDQQQKSNKLMGDMSQGKKDMLTGAAMVAAGAGGAKALTSLAEKAGQIQMQDIQLGGIYGYGINSKQIQALEKQAQSMSQKTLFSKADLMGINLELAHAGLSYKNLQKAAPEATYLSEVEVGMGKSASANDTSYNFARMVDDAKISNSAKKMKNFADSMYRVINVTHASSESLGETFKYAMPVTKQLGWNENDLLLASAVAARSGMEGSMAGTNIKDFVQRINPYKFLGTKGGQKQLDAMAEAGLIGNLSYEKDKKGKNTTKIDGFGSAALLKDKNHVKSYSDMVKILSAKHDAYIKSGHGELQWSALMNHIFGEQGQNFAVLSSHKDAAGKVTKQINGQQSLHKQINTIRQSFEGQMHVFKSNFASIGTELGKPIMQMLTPALTKANALLGKFMGFLQKNPKAGKIFADVAIGVSSFLILGGSLKILTGSIKFALAGFKLFKLTREAGEVSRFSKVLSGTGKALKSIGKVGASAFKFLGKGALSGVKALGSGLKTMGVAGVKAFKFLGKGTLTGLKLLGKSGLTVVKVLGRFGLALARLGIQAAAWAIRMAASWLVAMGPVGWIIMGVTAIIAAGILAWKTNFLGFKDKLIWVWNAVKSGSVSAWKGIKSGISTVVDWIKNLPGQALQWGSNFIKMFANGITGGIKWVEGAVKNVAKSVKSFLGFHSPAEKGPAGRGESDKWAPNFMKMYASGITSNIPLLAKASKNAALTLKGNFGSSQSSQIAVNHGGAPVEIHIHPHPNQRAEEIADMVMRKLGKSTRGIALNTGARVNMGAM